MRLRFKNIARRAINKHGEYEHQCETSRSQEMNIEYAIQVCCYSGIETHKRNT